jgi:hypothetical protein
MDGSKETLIRKKPLCELCKTAIAEWVSIWEHGQPRFTLLQLQIKYPESAVKLCDTCKEISSTRFRP